MLLGAVEAAGKRGKTVDVKAVQADLSLGLDTNLRQKLDALNVKVGVLGTRNSPVHALRLTPR